MSFCETATSLIGVLRALVEALNSLSINWMALACIAIGAYLISHHPTEAAGLITGGFALLNHRAQQ
jgi:hypothetical protein